MSDERQEQEKREREQEQLKIQERLKKLEEQNTALASTNERLLSDSKKYKEKAKGFEAEKADQEEQKRAIQEAKLREQGEYKQLLEQRDKDLLAANERAESAEKESSSSKETLMEAKKLNAFRSRLGGQLKSDDCLQFVDTSKIVVNPEDGKIDLASVDSVVKDYTSKYDFTIEKRKGRLPNGQGGGGGGGGLDHETWSKGGSKKKLYEGFEASYKAHNQS